MFAAAARCTIVLALAASLVLAGDAADRFVPVAERLMAAVNAADYAAMARDFAPIMLQAFPKEKAEPFFAGVVQQFGKMLRLGTPRFIPPDQAVFPATFERGILDLKIVLDEHNRITGLWLLPHVPQVPVPDKHATALSLPVKGGRWLVFWGGDTKELNQHHDVPNQRFAFDLLGVDEAGNTHRGEGKTNEDYYAFGRAVVAPAAGVVTEVIEGVRDNSPGSMNPYSALGNAVIIQHGPQEVSVLAHLKQGSTTVRPGDKVTPGHVVGLCGNSGNSSEPHLHYHLQHTPVIQDGVGIKVFFEKVVVVGKDGSRQCRTKYSPVKGDILETDAER